jgi:hypothetical protein
MSNKYAVLVGINAYKGDNKLRGCINDVNNVKKMLISGGFLDKDITVLKNSQATARNISESLGFLVKRKDANVVFHFSGHGSQIKDRNGITQELICPYDYEDHWDFPFTDTVLKEILAGKDSSTRLTIILDSCFSGGMSRSVVSLKRGRYLHAPNSLRPIPNHNTNRFGVKQNRIYNVDKTMKHVLLAACKQNETAADAFICTYQGAWTYGLTTSYKALKSPKVWELYGAAAARVISGGFGQHPIMEGPKDLVEAVFL